jgi:hypothetical protein
MAAQITAPIVAGAPGGTVVIPGTDLTAGGSAGAVIAGQGACQDQTTTLPVVFNGTTATITLPDGVRDGVVTLTSDDGSTASVPLRVNSQYVFASEYIGEGPNTAGFAMGELDALLQRASGYADAYLAQGSASSMTLRLLQWKELSRYRKRTRRVYPRRWPIVSIEAFKYIASPALTIDYPTDSFVVVPDEGYIELVIWSIGYTYIQALSSFTMYDAGICELVYTAGFTFAEYPQVLREAVKMIATELIAQRGIQASGMGGLDSTRQNLTQYDRRSEPFTIPAPAKELLNSLRMIRPS